MANPKHLKKLQQGVKAWNQWLKERKPCELLDLSGASLRDASLRDANLCAAILRDADFCEAYLFHANLNRADLKRANFSEAKLNFADLSYEDLGGAKFWLARLNGADLGGADLGGADLSGADLSGANLSGANLTRTVLTEAKFGNTNVGNVDLSAALGLETVSHSGPSTIGIDTIYKSHGNIPDKFLRDAGVPEEVIDIARSIRCGPTIQWHSCFISYSSKDEEFAKRLHARMRAANMRVWFAPEDLKGGKKLYEQLFEAIQLHDKLLLVLSDSSILSEWVMTEIRKALAQEKKENRRKLFPIRLVDFDTLQEWTCFDADRGKDLAVEVREYAMPNDFSKWKDHDSFEAAFARLQNDLRAAYGRVRIVRPISVN